jgi:hypothetical protein
MRYPSSGLKRQFQRIQMLFIRAARKDTTNYMLWSSATITTTYWGNFRKFASNEPTPRKRPHTVPNARSELFHPQLFFSYRELAHTLIHRASPRFVTQKIFPFSAKT